MSAERALAPKGQRRHGPSESEGQAASRQALMKLRREAIMVVPIVIVGGFIAMQFELFEALMEFTRAHEDWELDELFSGVMVASVFLVFYAIRRGVQLKRALTAHLEAEGRIRKLAYFDPLTGLPNRVLARRRLEERIAEARRTGSVVAVLYLDLDEFKLVNDTHGHDIGDRLLGEIARRLTSACREVDTISRLSGDEFMIVLAGLSNPEQAVVAAERITDGLTRPALVEGHELRTTASIGIATYPDNGDTVEDLLKFADQAMYHVKEHGKGNFQFFSSEINETASRRLALRNGLRTAIERNELSLHYQLQRSGTSRGLHGVEALLRWQSPELGSVSPLEFIPVAEETGLIVPIGEWVLRTACTQAREWQRNGFPPFRIAVNVSNRQLWDESFVARVKAVLTEVDLEPRFLDVEITESAVIGDVERATRRVLDLQELGVSISLDDFGTGYSSMGYLRQLGVDTIKIDRSFVQGLPACSEDAAITRAIIAVAQSLQMSVIAEGVETEEQARFLLDNECDGLQGYLLGRPVPAEEFTRLLQGEPVAV